MKINKLFHWLYALIMLLPIGYIGGFTLYSVFNKNAYLSNSITETQPQVETNIEYQYKYQTNEVNGLNDFVNGNYYFVDEIDFSNYFDFFDDSGLEEIYFETYNFTINGGLSFYADELILDSFVSKDMRCDLVVYYYSNQDYGAYFMLRDGADLSLTFYYDDDLQNLVVSDVVFCYFTGSYVNDYLYYSNNLPSVLPVEYNLIDSAIASVTIIPGEPGTLDNAFNYALENLNNLPFFAWSQNTFFSAPFNYIANLFGIASSNPICSLLSYWFSISVIWLVFDVMLYVPLLVHRWLDKASIS